MPVRDIIIAALLFACLPPCFFRPFWGVLMWIIVGLVNPHTFMWQMTYEFPWALAVALPTMAGFVVFSRGWNRLVSTQTILIGVLWGWFTFTTFHNTGMPEFAHFEADTWFRWGFVSKVLLMAVVMTGIVDTRERFRTVLLVICGCLGFLVIKALPFMVLTGGAFRLYGPRGSMLADNNDLGLALNMTLPLLFFMSRTDPNPRIRKIMGFLFFTTIPAILFTYSRGALLGMGVVLLFMIMAMRQRILLIPILLLVALFAVSLTPERWQHRMDFRREGALIDDSALSRFNAWTYCWRLAQEYPLTGGGFEAFTSRLFYQYAPNPNDVHGPHSIYFGVLAEHGFVGLGLYLALLGSTFLSLRRIARDARYSGDETLEAYAKMLQISLVGFLVSGAFLGRAYFDYYFTIIACTAMLKHSAEESRKDDFTSEAEEQCQIA
jgi:probable O-glycosylation ligase (exosortase A-associated)